MKIWAQPGFAMFCSRMMSRYLFLPEREAAPAERRNHSLHTSRVMVGALCLAVAVSAPAKDETLVLTELPPLYSITASLAAGTHIRVQNIPADGRRMNALPRYLEKPGEANLALFQRAEAVVTMGKLWHDAPLFAAVRAQNIRVVNIDATEPYSPTLSGVALIRPTAQVAPWAGAALSATPDSTPSIYFWLSPSNGARAAEIIAQDLKRLAPADAERIAQNLTAYRRALFDLRQEFESKFAAVETPTLFALTQDFDYLIGDLGLFVEGYFVKQDLEWTAADLQGLRNYLQERRVPVVLHKWPPNDAIQEAIRSGGATLVVLRTAEDGIVQAGSLSSEGYLMEMRQNLQSLHDAFSNAAKR
jgi:ABC-type Zn uptake system ZnuABC Zn-binding protein ZnuA